MLTGVHFQLKGGYPNLSETIQNLFKVNLKMMDGESEYEKKTLRLKCNEEVRRLEGMRKYVSCLKSSLPAINETNLKIFEDLIEWAFSHLAAEARKSNTTFTDNNVTFTIEYKSLKIYKGTKSLTIIWNSSDSTLEISGQLYALLNNFTAYLKSSKKLPVYLSEISKSQSLDAIPIPKDRKEFKDFTNIACYTSVYEELTTRTQSSGHAYISFYIYLSPEDITGDINALAEQSFIRLMGKLKFFSEDKKRYRNSASRGRVTEIQKINRTGSDETLKKKIRTINNIKTTKEFNDYLNPPEKTKFEEALLENFESYFEIGEHLKLLDGDTLNPINFEVKELGLKNNIGHQDFLSLIVNQEISSPKLTRLAIVGDQGSGKTSLLYKIAREIIICDLGIPIWIPIRSVGRGINLRDFIFGFHEELIANARYSEEHMREIIKSKKLWVFLDETSEKQGESFSNSTIIEEISRHWANNIHLVCSCRLSNWDSNNISEFKVYQTLGLKTEDIIKSITNSLRGEQRNRFNSKEKTHLTNEIDASDDHFLKNMLILANQCKLYQASDYKRPTNKTSIFKNVFIDSYNQKHTFIPSGLSNKLTINNLLGFLSSLAQKLLDRSDGKSYFEFEYEWMCNQGIVRKHFPEIESTEPITPDQILAVLVLIGFLCRSKDKKFSFQYRAYQEYFAVKNFENSDNFLSSKHNTKGNAHSLASKESDGAESYRIFETQWQEAIILWMTLSTIPDSNNMESDITRSDITKSDEIKQKFVEKLINFTPIEPDNSSLIDLTKIYYFRAKCLAAICLNQYTNDRRDTFYSELITEGLNHFEEWSLIYPKFPDLILQIFERTLSMTYHENVILKLEESLKMYQKKYEIDQNRDRVLDSIVLLIHYSICRVSTGNIENESTINNSVNQLIQLLKTTNYSWIRWRISSALGSLRNHKDRITSSLLSELSLLSQLEEITFEKYHDSIIDILGRFECTDKQVEEEIVKSINLFDRKTCRTDDDEWSLWRLLNTSVKIKPTQAKINQLYDLGKNTKQEEIRFRSYSMIENILDCNMEKNIIINQEQKISIDDYLTLSLDNVKLLLGKFTEATDSKQLRIGNNLCMWFNNSIKELALVHELRKHSIEYLLEQLSRLSRLRELSKSELTSREHTLEILERIITEREVEHTVKELIKLKQRLRYDAPFKEKFSRVILHCAQWLSYRKFHETFIPK